MNIEELLAGYPSTTSVQRFYRSHCLQHCLADDTEFEGILRADRDVADIEERNFHGLRFNNFLNLLSEAVKNQRVRLLDEHPDVEEVGGIRELDIAIHAFRGYHDTSTRVAFGSQWLANAFYSLYRVIIDTAQLIDYMKERPEHRKFLDPDLLLDDFPTDSEQKALAWETEAKKRTKQPERKACLFAAAKWRDMDHFAAHDIANPDGISNESTSKKSFGTKAYHIAKKIADDSEGRLVISPRRKSKSK